MSFKEKYDPIDLKHDNFQNESCQISFVSVENNHMVDKKKAK